MDEPRNTEYVYRHWHSHSLHCAHTTLRIPHRESKYNGTRNVGAGEALGLGQRWAYPEVAFETSTFPVDAIRELASVVDLEGWDWGV